MNYHSPLFVAESEADPYNGHAFVDLGLPSKLKWAKYNVGATSEMDAGLYFAWGDTDCHAADSGYEFTEDNYNAKGLNLLDSDLDLEHDAARANMGGQWRIPTNDECIELCVNCYAEWTDDYNGTGKAGIIFYSCANNATGKGFLKGHDYEGVLKWGQYTGGFGVPYTTVSQPDGLVAYTLATPHIFLPYGDSGLYLNSTYKGESYCGYMLISNSYINPDGLGFFGREEGMTVRGICK